MKTLHWLATAFVAFGTFATAHAQTHGYGPIMGSSTDNQSSHGYTTPAVADPSSLTTLVPKDRMIVHMREPNGMRRVMPRTPMLPQLPERIVVTDPYGRAGIPTTPDRMVAYAAVPGMKDMNGLRNMGQSIREQLALSRMNVRNDMVHTTMVETPVTVNPTISVVTAPQQNNTNEQVINNTFDYKPSIVVDVDAGQGGQGAQTQSDSSNKSGGLLGKLDRGVNTLGSIVGNIPVIGGILKKLF